MSKIIRSNFKDHKNILDWTLLKLEKNIIYATDLIYHALIKKNLILWCGNGGSASDSMHLSAEFIGRFNKKRKSLNSISLSSNSPALPAISNDFGYKNVFSRQIEGLGKKNDLLVVFSTSGNSENIIRALKKAKKIGMTIFSSPFDNSAVDLLEDLNTPAYKIASFEIVDLPLIDYVAKTGKPIIISTGMANSEEIQEAIETAKEGGCKELAILHCVSGYPAPAKDYNLRTLVDMQQKFGLVTGLSDHTVNNTTAIASIALGASIIEKHVTLNRNSGGPDDSFSLESKELKELCTSARIAWKSLGEVDYRIKSSEQGSVKFRRSLYFIKDIKAGEVITEEHIKSIRPGFGLAPKLISKIIGKKVIQNVQRGTAVYNDLLK